MFEIESKNPDVISIKTSSGVVNIDFTNAVVDAGLAVGEIRGAGEYEVGDAAIRAIAVKANAEDAVAGAKAGVIYDVLVNGTHIAILGGHEDGLDELAGADIVCTSSVRAVRELEPKLVVATGNVDGMVTELKVTARTEKKLKYKGVEGLPATLEVVVLN